MKTIKFYTLGCKVNQYDTQSIRERFLARGFKEASNDKADIYVINTCTVTAVADSKSKDFIRRSIKNNPKAKVIVTGCLVGEDTQVLSDIKGVTHIISKRFFPDGVTGFAAHTRAFLKIQDGCDNFCSYCKVPLVRGRSRSRPFEEVVGEAEKLVAQGFKEIVLTGICLGAYGKDLKRGIVAKCHSCHSEGGRRPTEESLCLRDSSLRPAGFAQNDTKLRILQQSLSIIDVISALEKIDGLLRIRLSSIEAGDVSSELIRKMAASDKLCHHLHIPIQSGDDEILKKMNRKYRSKDYLALVNKIKKSIPDVAITTDIIVGFPGETEVNFQNTLDLVEKILPLRVHAFPYSERKGTLAAKNSGEKISPEIVKERIRRLKEVSETCALKYKKQFQNKKLSVLIEGRSKDVSGCWEGYSSNYIKVLVKSNSNLHNKLISIDLTSIVRYD